MITAPRISFIVPVRNDAARLDACLRSIRQNVGAASRDEIIVIDNGSSDGSADVARRHGARVLDIPERVRVSELRNRAAEIAAGQVFAFVDSDNEIWSGWSVAALESLRGPSVGAVGAPYLAPIDGTWVQRAYGVLRGRAQGIRDVEWLGSGNLAVWREGFEAVGGFDVSLETCEDVDFCQRLGGTGRRVLSDARLKSVHHGDPETLGALLRGERWRGRDNLRVTLRRPLNWTQLPSAIIPVVDVVMLIAMVVGALLAVMSPAAGVTLILLAAAVMGAGALAKVLKILARDGIVLGLSVVHVWIVACVYDIGRALAIVSPARHRNDTPATARLSQSTATP